MVLILSFIIFLRYLNRCLVGPVTYRHICLSDSRLNCRHWADRPAAFV